VHWRQEPHLLFGEQLIHCTTVNQIATLLESVPDVPVIVNEDLPVGVELLTVRVSVLVEVAGFGLNDAVTPLGNPVAVRVTFPLKPFAGVMVTVLVP
jgi:hypothetical protein